MFNKRTDCCVSSEGEWRCWTGINLFTLLLIVLVCLNQFTIRWDGKKKAKSRKDLKCLPSLLPTKANKKSGTDSNGNSSNGSRESFLLSKSFQARNSYRKKLSRWYKNRNITCDKLSSSFSWFLLKQNILFILYWCFKLFHNKEN